MELLLSMAIAGIMFGIAAETLMQQAATFSFIANRKTTIADVRNTMNEMTHEMQHIDTADIVSISSTQIQFIDENGNHTSYNLDTDGDGLAIYRGNTDVLLPNVNDFTIEYQDASGTALSLLPADLSQSIQDTRRIKLTITTEPSGNEGSITISTLVIPRGFLGYANYQ